MAVTYIPSAKYAFPRSYIRGIQVSISPGWFVEINANPLKMRINLPLYTAWIEYHYFTEFYTWSSNAYTLDHVISRVNYYDTLGNANDVDTYSVGYSSDVDVKCFYIHVDLAGSSKLFQVDLPQPPLPYWTETPPCPEILS